MKAGGNFALFPRLQIAQRRRRFSITVIPPFDHGIKWSTCNTQPRCVAGLSPHRTQRKRSLFNTSYRSPNFIRADRRRLPGEVRQRRRFDGPWDFPMLAACEFSCRVSAFTRSRNAEAHSSIFPIWQRSRTVSTRALDPFRCTSVAVRSGSKRKGDSQNNRRQSNVCQDSSNTTPACSNAVRHDPKRRRTVSAFILAC